jgi:hypothetical protein
MKKTSPLKWSFILALAGMSFSFALQAQQIANKPASPAKKVDSLQINVKDYQWSIGFIFGGKTKKSPFVRDYERLSVYDFGIQVTKSIALGHRIRIEGTYRTSSDFVQPWGSTFMNMKTDINTPIGGISYEWFPFVRAGAKAVSIWKFKPNFFHSLKIKAGAWYVQDPIYRIEATLVDPVKWGNTVFTNEEIGSVKLTVATEKIQPFLGLGYDRFYVGKRTNISLEGGLLYQGKPQVVMIASNVVELTSIRAPVLQSNMSNFSIIPFAQILLQIRL